LSEAHRRRLDEIEAQRDNAQSKLASAHRRILDLSNEVLMLRARLDDLSPPPIPLNGKSKKKAA
jgi:chromosome segregation ATPase